MHLTTVIPTLIAGATSRAEYAYLLETPDITITMIYAITYLYQIVLIEFDKSTTLKLMPNLFLF